MDHEAREEELWRLRAVEIDLGRTLEERDIARADLATKQIEVDTAKKTIIEQTRLLESVRAENKTIDRERAEVRDLNTSLKMRLEVLQAEVTRMHENERMLTTYGFEIPTAGELNRPANQRQGWRLNR